MNIDFWGVWWSSLGRSSGRTLEARDEIWEAAEVVCSARIVLR